jgi:phenylpropionate dioxygenase-like ring-hydroxylating dioxygenase large terminal subunit
MDVRQRPLPQNWAQDYSALRNWNVPVEPCFSPSYFELERERIFRRVWLQVGRVEEIPKPGDYFVKELKVCNASVLVVRSQAGAVRAFYNVCAHRSNKLAWECRGSAKRFTCNFHGWTYDLDGKLIGVPDEESFVNFDRSGHGLRALATDTWEGFIFINFADPPNESLSEYLGEWAEEHRGYPFHKITAGYQWNALVNCNWKVALDAFQEAYHVPFIHKHSIAGAIGTRSNPHDHPLLIKLYKYHRKLSMGADPKSVYGNPLLIYSDQAREEAKRQQSIAGVALKLGASDKDDFSPAELPSGLNPTRSANWAWDINAIFPNFYLPLRPNYYQAYTFWPISAGQTEIELRVFYMPARSAAGRFYQEYRKVNLRDVLLEDFSTLEQSQSVLASGAHRYFTLQDNELAVVHLHKVVDEFVHGGHGAESE